MALVLAGDSYSFQYFIVDAISIGRVFHAPSEIFRALLTSLLTM
jgi:hypothetical protein